MWEWSKNHFLASACFSCHPFYKTLVRNWIKTDLSIFDLFPWVKPGKVLSSLCIGCKPALHFWGSLTSKESLMLCSRSSPCLPQGSVCRVHCIGVVCRSKHSSMGLHCWSFHSSFVEVPSLGHRDGFTVMAMAVPKQSRVGKRDREHHPFSCESPKHNHHLTCSFCGS